MPSLYFEDFPVGGVLDFGPRVVTREEIIAYASEFDPQPFHLDEEAGRASMLGGLCASGWHTCSLLMRMICDAYLLDTASMGAPGIEEVRWRLPVRPGDPLTVRRTALEARVSKSRPEIGLVRMRFEMFNGKGACVMTLVTTLMVLTRASTQMASSAASLVAQR